MRLEVFQLFPGSIITHTVSGEAEVPLVFFAHLCPLGVFSGGDPAASTLGRPFDFPGTGSTGSSGTEESTTLMLARVEGTLSPQEHPWFESPLQALSSEAPKAHRAARRLSGLPALSPPPPLTQSWSSWHPVACMAPCCRPAAGPRLGLQHRVRRPVTHPHNKLVQRVCFHAAPHYVNPIFICPCTALSFQHSCVFGHNCQQKLENTLKSSTDTARNHELGCCGKCLTLKIPS